jgi:hypothetical protein
MLSLPTSGFARSVSVDRVSLVELCDWIEASLLFGDDRLGQNEVVDVLCEHGIYAEQDMARGKVADAWAEIRRRLRCLGVGSSFDFNRTVARRLVPAWNDSPAHSFCLILSCASLYSSWSSFESDGYNEQGELFELLCKEAVEIHFPGWQVELTGWAGQSINADFCAIVERTCQNLLESAGDLFKWTSGDEKDAELDLLCYKPFPDHRPGLPAFFMQCASGALWRRKLHTPRLQVWRKLVDFCVDELPRKGFAIPFALLADDFNRTSNITQGLFMDRYRLLAVNVASPNWVSGELKQRLLEWCAPRVERLHNIAHQI